MSSSRDYSANGFGDDTRSDRRDRSVSEDTDPSEHSFDTADSSTRSATSRSRSATPIPEPPPRSVFGTRVRVTARKSVPIPIRRTFTIPPRDEAEPSRIRDRSVTPPLPPPEDRAPVARPAGMTPLENYWVTGMAREVEAHQMRLNAHDQQIDGLMGIMETNDEVLNKTRDVIVDLRRSIRRLYSYLAMMVVAFLVVLGLMVWWMMF